MAVLGLTLLVAGLAQQLHVSAAVGAFLVGIALSGEVAEGATQPPHAAAGPDAQDDRGRPPLSRERLSGSAVLRRRPFRHSDEHPGSRQRQPGENSVQEDRKEAPA